MINRIGNNWQSEYNYQAYREIVNILNNYCVDLGYVSGVKGISYLLDLFLGSSYKANKTYFFNAKNNEFIEVYSATHNGNPCYFSYHKMASGRYELQEVPAIYIESLKSIYTAKYLENLVLQDADDAYKGESKIKK